MSISDTIMIYYKKAMKLKTIINILLILFFFSCFNSSISFALDTKEAAIKKIENEMQQCIKISLDNKQNCCYNAMGKYRVEIKKTLYDFKKVLSSSQYETLVLNQKKWEEFERSNSEMLNTIMNRGNNIIFKAAQRKVDIIKNILKYFNEYYGTYIFLNTEDIYD